MIFRGSMKITQINFRELENTYLPAVFKLFEIFNIFFSIYLFPHYCDQLLCTRPHLSHVLQVLEKIILILVGRNRFQNENPIIRSAIVDNR